MISLRCLMLGSVVDEWNDSKHKKKKTCNNSDATVKCGLMDDL